MLSPRPQYHTEFWLAAVALLLVVMLANLDRVERQIGGELRINLVHAGAVRFGARGIRLAADDDQPKASALQLFERCGGPDVMTNSLRSPGGYGLPLRMIASF